jgi:hypothetical protein
MAVSQPFLLQYTTSLSLRNVMEIQQEMMEVIELAMMVL